MLEEVEECITTKLNHLRAGESLIYYTGFLAHDSFMNKEGADYMPAREAYKLFEKGRVHLTQRRTGDSPSKFEYIATGTPNEMRVS